MGLVLGIGSMDVDFDWYPGYPCIMAHNVKIGWLCSIENIDHGMVTLTGYTLFKTALDRGKQALSSEGFHPAWVQTQDSCVSKRVFLGSQQTG